MTELDEARLHTVRMWMAQNDVTCVDADGNDMTRAMVIVATARPTPDTAAMERAFAETVMAHRKAIKELGRVMMANARRGASEQACNEINRAGEEMARTERVLLDLYRKAVQS